MLVGWFLLPFWAGTGFSSSFYSEELDELFSDDSMKFFLDLKLFS